MKLRVGDYIECVDVDLGCFKPREKYKVIDVYYSDKYLMFDVEGLKAPSWYLTDQFKIHPAVDYLALNRMMSVGG